jgi:CheY-like chemotaxis protein
MPVLNGEVVKSLEESGFRLAETLDPDEAVSICERSKPAIAFVEVDAPQRDNFDVLRQIRDALQRRGRIVAICNRYSDALDDYCETLGANFARPQITDGANFKLLVRGLMTLIPAESDERRYTAS